MLLSDGHHAFRADFRPGYPDMGGQYGRQGRVELRDMVGHNLSKHLLQLLVNLLKGEIPGVFAAEQGASSQPWQRSYLDDPVLRLYFPDFRLKNVKYCFLRKRIEPE